MIFSPACSIEMVFKYAIRYIIKSILVEFVLLSLLFSV